MVYRMRSNTWIYACMALVALSVVQVPATAQDLLKGKVQRVEGPVRIRRPELPALDAPLKDARISANQALGDDSAFVPSMNKMSPVIDITDYGAPIAGKVEKDTLNGEAESDELLIAWEEWHKRISQAIFRNWQVNGDIAGEARATMRFSRDCRVQVEIHTVEIYLESYEPMPPSRIMEMRAAFAQKVRDSLSALDRTLVLQFPRQSRRQLVEINTTFRGTPRGDSSYGWIRGDYERIPVNH